MVAEKSKEQKPKRVSQKQALAYATKRWGDAARIQITGKARLHYVGRVVMGLFFEVEGQGLTWGEAVADAERKRTDGLS